MVTSRTQIAISPRRSLEIMRVNGILKTAFCPGMNVEFDVNVLKVPPDRIQRDVELTGDFLVGKPTHHQFQHLAFSRGKSFQIGVNGIIIVTYFTNFALVS